MNKFWGFFIGIILGITFGLIIGAAATMEPVEKLKSCQEDLSTCQQTLNDPHACVSVVVEIMEGHYETNTNIN